MDHAAFACLLVLSCGLVVVSWCCQQRLLRSAPPAMPQAFPPVSILKPLKGADAGLENNLRAFFRLDYPAYELLFGARDADDPGLLAARRVATEHPGIPVTFVADDRVVGLNPKVNNLANLARHASHELLLVSDSNVRVRPEYLREIVACLERPGVGLVSSAFRGAGARGIGGRLEALQLDTFVMGGVATVSDLLGRPCVVGKSMLLRRDDLERVGGFRELGRYLAEDQVCGERMHALGLRTVVSGHVIDNVLGPLRVRDFVARHLRWARIRWRIGVPGYAVEGLANPVAIALVGVGLGLPGAVAAFLAAWALTSALALSTARRLGTRGGWELPLLELARSVLVAACWPIPLVHGVVTWRGNRFRVGRKTLLEPLRVPARLRAEPAAHAALPEST